MPGPDDDRPSSEKRNLALLVARYTGLALMLPAATFVGWFLGVLLDKWWHTTWLYIVGLILGMVAGFVELIRAVSGPESKQ